jgi:hypothetical protein
MGHRLKIITALLLILFVAADIFGIALSVYQNQRRIDEMALIQETSARTLRDLHCALLGYQGPKSFELQLQNIQLDPKKDCGPILPQAAGTEEFLKKENASLIAQIKKLLDRPTIVVVHPINRTTYVVQKKDTVLAPAVTISARATPAPAQPCARKNGKPCK